MWTRYLFILLVLVTQITHAQHVEVYDYAVIKGKKHLGVQKVSRTISGNKVEYDIDSDVTFSLVTKRHMVFSIHSLEIDDRLEYAELSELLNDKLRYTATIKRNGNNYSINDTDGYQSRAISQEKVWSVSRLYFEEPKGIDSAFSERHGSLLEITSNKDGSYNLELPSGSTNVYIYENGVCKKVIVNHWIATINIVRL